ncbi:hypothetical protein BD770DRAFT_136516 [Pilaira anomala]|nr:hypothetical protein BD770DRAFT_136516 [Pilaira anomala]
MKIVCSHDPKQFKFSGTDNELVNMTATALFSRERFKFHLKLHNYYSVLNDIIPASDTELGNFFKYT